MMHTVEELIRRSEPKEENAEESALFQQLTTETCNVCGGWKETRKEKESVMKIDDKGRNMDYVRKRVAEATYETIDQPNDEPGNI